MKAKRKHVLFSNAMALKVKYPMITPRRLIDVLSIPKTRVIDVSKDTVMIVSQEPTNSSC